MYSNRTRTRGEGDVQVKDFLEEGVLVFVSRRRAKRCICPAKCPLVVMVEEGRVRPRSARASSSRRGGVGGCASWLERSSSRYLKRRVGCVAFFALEWDPPVGALEWIMVTRPCEFGMYIKREMEAVWMPVRWL